MAYKTLPQTQNEGEGWGAGSCGTTPMLSGKWQAFTQTRLGRTCLAVCHHQHQRRRHQQTMLLPGTTLPQPKLFESQKWGAWLGGARKGC